MHTKFLTPYLNIQFTAEGDGGKIGNVSPIPGALVSLGSKITIETSDTSYYNNSVIMPDFTGYRKDEAEDILTSLGLKCYFKGNTDGVVAGQNIEAGSLIKTSSYIKLTLYCIKWRYK